MTPDQARQRLAHARQTMAMARALSRGRETFDPQAQLVAALEEVISFLEDALA